MTVDNAKTTPKLIQALDAVIDRHLYDLHTSMPGEVVSYDYPSNTAVIQPSLRRKYKTETTAVRLPTISDVPVSFQRLGGAHLRLPVNSKDTGQLVFNERSIDGWLQSGGEIDPLDPRKHSLADAVFYPGLNPNNNPMKSLAAEDSLELKLNGSYIEILANGKFKISNGTEENFDLLVKWIQELSNTLRDVITHTHTSSVPTTPSGPPLNAAALTATQVKVDLIQVKLETFKE